MSKYAMAQTFFSLLNESGQDRYYKNEPKFLKRFTTYMEKVENSPDFKWIIQKIEKMSNEHTKSDARKFSNENNLRHSKFFSEIGWY